MPPRTPSAMLSLAVTAIWPCRHRAADGHHHAAGHLGPVRQRSAELVVAAVDQRTQERARQIVVAQMDFDGVEAGVDGKRAALACWAITSSMSSRVAFLANRIPIGLKNRTGARARGLVGAGVGDRAGVADLRADRRALGVDRVGEPAQPGHGLRAHPEPVAGGAAAGGDRAVGDGGHARRRRRPAAGGIRSGRRMTSASGVRSSNVAALMIRLRSVTGPSLAGAEDIGASDTWREPTAPAIARSSVPECQAWVQSRWTARPRATRSSST